MKIDLHNEMLKHLVSPTFIEGINEIVNLIAQKDKSVKKVQMYGDYVTYVENKRFGNYMFEDKEKVYYPLTVIHKNKEWNIQWVSWSKCDVEKSVVFRSDKKVKIQLCEAVPREFTDITEGKNLVYFKNGKKVKIECKFGLLGRINQKFIDAFVHQIYDEMVRVWGVELSSKWDVVFLDYVKTVEIGGKKYRSFAISNSGAETKHFGVCWNGNCDISDEVDSDLIKFELTEVQFDKYVSSFDEVKEFLSNGGFVWNWTSNEGSQANDKSLSDVILVFSLKDKPSKKITEEILGHVAEFIKKWNENTIDEPIHDFSLIDSEKYNEISIHVDLGNSTSSALDGLLKHLELNLSNPRIKKIGLQ